MLPDIRNPFFAEILDGLSDRIAGARYQVLLCPGCNGEDAEARVIHAMIDRGMDGMILIAPSPRGPTSNMSPASCPPSSSRHGRSHAYDTVADDDLSGAALVVNHPADLGHRRIAHIEHHETSADCLAEMPNAIRAEGYRQAMRVAG
ncbi:substrate-binding domain-containing protein [Micromonospora sp. MA102]|uniref:substrate-binding domain-containing protein n=1 Tax=Micromonospora sp. MA102 TaxID=2952755 RepID=UPI0029057728|nr:substrate-binding domain-containing protein [Micromonospora sp. MA102]